MMKTNRGICYAPSIQAPTMLSLPMSILMFAIFLFAINTNDIWANSDDKKSEGQESAVATFAGGCFWCMEPPFDKLDGVLATTSGYVGGSIENPSYDEVSTGTTGHYEAVQVKYNPSVVGYEKLLDVFWKNIDPVDANGQFCDRGPQYRSAIFYHNDEQLRLANSTQDDLPLSNKQQQNIATPIIPVQDFYPAEEYHQNYYEKNPLRYRFYRFRCGRDDRLEELWNE